MRLSDFCLLNFKTNQNNWENKYAQKDRLNAYYTVNYNMHFMTVICKYLKHLKMHFGIILHRH